MMRVAAALALLLASAGAGAQTCPPLREYDEIMAAVSEHFFDRSFNGLDWEAQVALHRSRIACDDGPQELARHVNALLVMLDASHTALYTRFDQHYWGLNSFFWRANAHYERQSGVGAGDRELADAYQIAYAGIWAEQSDGTWYARFVMEDSPAARAGVRVGDELIAIDGAAFDPLGFDAGRSRLTLSSDGQSRRDVELETTYQSITLGFENAARASARILEIDGKRIGFFHLWAGGGAILEIMNGVFRDFAGARLDVLLIDMRGGYGGMGEEYLDELRNNPRLQSVPKYFVIDDSLRSGKELVAGVIRRDELGTLVGSRTAGQYLGGRRVSLFDDKYFLYVAVGDGPTPVIEGIGEIEGNGIEPHVLVESCRIHCAGRDPELERALDLIVNGR